MAVIDFNTFPRQVLDEPHQAVPFPQDDFRRAMFNAGFVVHGDINPDGKIHRFGVKKENWYVFHGDGVPAGAYGSWKTGDSFDWCSKAEIQMTPEETYAYRVRLDNIKAEREAEVKRQHEEAAREAEKTWREAQPLDSHPYLTRKGVKNHGARMHKGAILIPLTDISGNILSYQTIGPGGQKYFLAGGQKKGLFFWIKGSGKIAIVEGYATGATVHELTGWETVVAFDAGNLEPVARTVREAKRTADIVICADDDHATPGNPGATKAKEAADAVGATVLLPTFREHAGKSDWNDLAQAEGPAEAKRQLEAGSKARVVSAAEWIIGVKYVGPAPKREYLVDGVLPLGACVVLAAQGGSGKGFLELDLALKVASDPDTMFPTGPDLNGPLQAFGCDITAHGPVIMFSAEDDADEIHRRLEALGRRPDYPVSILPLPDLTGPMPLIVPGKSGPETTAAWKDVEGEVADFGPKLVIIDPLAAFAMVDINADPACAQFVMMLLANLAKRSGACVLVAHHMAKAVSKAEGGDDARLGVRGSSAIVDGARGVYALWKATDDETRAICGMVGVDYISDRVWAGQLVKSNYAADKTKRTYVRNSFGLLEVYDEKIKTARITNVATVKAAIIRIVAEAEKAGNPFVRCCHSKNGMHKRVSELPMELTDMSRRDIQNLVDDMLKAKEIYSNNDNLSIINGIVR